MLKESAVDPPAAVALETACAEWPSENPETICAVDSASRTALADSEFHARKKDENERDEKRTWRLQTSERRRKEQGDEGRVGENGRRRKASLRKSCHHLDCPKAQTRYPLVDWTMVAFGSHVQKRRY